VENKSDALRGKRQRNKGIAELRRQAGARTPDYRRDDCEEDFTCKVCGFHAAPEGAGTGHRNHCPRCLASVHVDNEPGDRASECGGTMEAVSVWVRGGGEWALIHRCRVCGVLHSNRIAADDNPTLLMSIAVKPLASPPFPLWTLGQGLENQKE